MTARKQASLFETESRQWCHEVGGVLIRHRRAHGLSQEAAAAQLGLSQRLVAQMERNPDGVHVRRLLAALHLYGLEVVVRPQRRSARALGQPKTAGPPAIRDLFDAPNT